MNPVRYRMNMQNRFGWRDKIDSEITGKDGGPIQFKSAEEMSDDELASIIAAGDQSKPRNDGPVTRADAARELLSRRAARAGMAGYIEYMGMPDRPAKHHLGLDRGIEEAVARLDIPA